ncbi:MAG: hypothetical protein DWQ04_04170 [Chloroflexi bacterium]|nr:MAG: hypothetical protein DWQ04_04170 [Chloroflexota bacterium]
MTFLTLSPHGAGSAYGTIPLGLGLLLWSFAFVPFVPSNRQLPLIFVGGIVTFLGLFIFPKFLNPKWLWWLIQEHGDIIPILRNEIQEMGDKNWDRQINIQEELEEWVLEVKQKTFFDPSDYL